MNTSVPTSIVFDFGSVVFPIEPYSGGPTTPEERREISGAMRTIAETHLEEIQRNVFTVDMWWSAFCARTPSVSPERRGIVRQSVCQPDPQVLDTITQLHGTFAIYGLVNAPYGWTEIRRSVNQFDRFFNRIVVSHEIDARKPDEKIFHHFLRITHTQPEQCVFIDDKEENCQAAKHIGFRVIRYQRPNDLRQLLPR